jgi:hypothetical protein
MLTKAFVTAAAAGLITASAAYAGDDHAGYAAMYNDTTSATAATTVNPSTSTSSTWNSSTGASAMSADTGISSNVSATVPMSTADALAAGGTVQIITSTPVADTPENRALYGEPMSMSGKRTRPAGN